MFVNLTALFGHAAAKIEVNYELADAGFEVFNPELPRAERELALQNYLNHPLMQVAFERYSNPRRSEENRVTNELYIDFVKKVWQEDFEAITHPRMRLILEHYKWGLANLEEVESDLTLIKAQMPSWLEAVQRKIPWDTPAVRRDDTPIQIIFLFDPGGSFPWVTEREGIRYIFINILQVRGLTDEERQDPIDPPVFLGLLVHELFHLYQPGGEGGQGFAGWLVKAAVNEGSACLIGNNAPNSSGQKLSEHEPIYFPPTLKDEWLSQIENSPQRIQDLQALVEEWRESPPETNEARARLTKDNWVASPLNGLFMGDLYRVGAEMLLDIKLHLGLDEFYEVIGDPGKLIETWKKTRARPDSM